MYIAARRLTIRIAFRCRVIYVGKILTPDFQAAPGAGSAPGQIVAGHTVKEGCSNEDQHERQND